MRLITGLNDCEKYFKQNLEFYTECVITNEQKVARFAGFNFKDCLYLYRSIVETMRISDAVDDIAATNTLNYMTLVYDLTSLNLNDD